MSLRQLAAAAGQAFFGWRQRRLGIETVIARSMRHAPASHIAPHRVPRAAVCASVFAAKTLASGVAGFRASSCRNRRVCSAGCGVPVWPPDDAVCLERHGTVWDRFTQGQSVDSRGTRNAGCMPHRVLAHVIHATQDVNHPVSVTPQSYISGVIHDLFIR